MSENKSSKELLKINGRIDIFIKLYLTVLIIVIMTEAIGIIKFSLGPGQVVLLPMLFAVIFGMAITPDLLGRVIPSLKNIISKEEIETSGPLVMISLLPLGVKYGTLVGPNIIRVVQAGPAFLLQELGNLGTICVALPLALLLGMKREAVGATASICREPTLGVIGERIWYFFSGRNWSIRNLFDRNGFWDYLFWSARSFICKLN
ncbi:hypothetical protein JOC26_002684 [Sporohalobacter salinus]|nr:DUF3100 domain-containing protein [Sporohalobacter salinus]MBM7625095.1 hypothetical protein [Sporohalobacter salinus]